MTLRDERGFTLAEVLVVLTISIVVLTATLTTFNHVFRAQHESDKRTESIEIARNTLDGEARQLRNLARRLTDPVIAVANSYELIFQTSDPTRTWVRYCLDATNATRGRLWTQSSTFAGTAPAAAPCGPTASANWSTPVRVADFVTNRIGGQDRALFSYSCTSGVACTPSASNYDQIVNITTQTIIDASPGREAPEMRVVSGVYLRNQNQAPTASFVATPKAGRSRTIVLNAAGSSDFEGRTLSYFWFKQTMPAVANIDCAQPNPVYSADGDSRTLWGVTSALNTNGFIGEEITLTYTFPAGDGAAGSTQNIGLVVCDPGDRSATAGITSPIPVTIPS
jgi:prepilin-type N-terminal cleavage/methylation domain-containing protein